MKPGKKDKKSKIRKDSSLDIGFRPIGIETVDQLFVHSMPNIRFACSLCSSQRRSLSQFREICGVSSLSCIKQCLRAIVRRSRVDCMTSPSASSDGSKSAGSRRKTYSNSSSTAGSLGGKSEVRRTLSNASQASTGSNTSLNSLSIVRQKERISLELKGTLALSESWKRIQLVFDTLMEHVHQSVETAQTACTELGKHKERIIDAYQVSTLFLKNPCLGIS